MDNFFNPNDELNNFFKEQDIKQKEQIKIEYGFSNTSRITKVENLLLYLDKNEIKKIKKRLCCSSKTIPKTKNIIFSGHQFELKNILKNDYSINMS